MHTAPSLLRRGRRSGDEESKMRCIRILLRSASSKMVSSRVARAVGGVDCLMYDFRGLDVVRRVSSRRRRNNRPLHLESSKRRRGRTLAERALLADVSLRLYLRYQQHGHLMISRLPQLTTSEHHRLPCRCASPRSSSVHPHVDAQSLSTILCAHIRPVHTFNLQSLSTSSATADAMECGYHLILVRYHLAGWSPVFPGRRRR